MKNTPGPWKADYAGGYGRRGVFGPNGLIITTWAENDKHIEEAIANAHLIAAAPDLLLVAKRVIAEHDADWDMPQELLEMSRQAIAKVEGI